MKIERTRRRFRDFVDTYTRDLTANDFQRLFTRDARDAYRFFARGLDADRLKHLPWHKRAAAHARALFMAFAMKLSPARRMLYAISLVLALIGLINLFRGVGIVRLGSPPFGIGVPALIFRQGTDSLLIAFLLLMLTLIRYWHYIDWSLR